MKIRARIQRHASYPHLPLSYDLESDFEFLPGDVFKIRGDGHITKFRVVGPIPREDEVDQTVVAQVLA